MATAERMRAPLEQPAEEGLKPGALGLVATTVIATASVAPVYSIAATLVFVVGAVGLQAPAVTVLAFVPMLLTSIGYSELNKADTDCGTTFTWATRAFGPRSGWAGGWAIIVADVLVMASNPSPGPRRSSRPIPRCLRRPDDRRGVYRLPAVGRRRRSSGELLRQHHQRFQAGKGRPLHEGRAGAGCAVMTVDSELTGQKFAALNRGPQFTFNEAISFQIPCADQAEVDYYWARLSEGGQEVTCGWLKDKYGLSWQVIPGALIDMISDPDPGRAKRVTEAMPAMTKLDIVTLQKAYAEPT